VDIITSQDQAVRRLRHDVGIGVLFCFRRCLHTSYELHTSKRGLCRAAMWRKLILARLEREQAPLRVKLTTVLVGWQTAGLRYLLTSDFADGSRESGPSDLRSLRNVRLFRDCKDSDDMMRHRR